MTDAPLDPSDTEPWTCGRGLAAHAPIPAKIAEFLDALANNLAGHVPTIDTRDAAGCRERDAYVDLSRDFAAISARLAGAAERMRGYRDLPAAGHDDEALAEPRLLELFASFVAVEDEVAALMADSARSDGELLRQLQGGVEEEEE